MYCPHLVETVFHTVSHEVKVDKGCSKNSPFFNYTTNSDVLSLFERFVIFIYICLTFTQSQCSHAVTLKNRRFIREPEAPSLRQPSTK